MSTPPLAIQVEPSESGSAVYLPLAATTKTGETQVKLMLLLRLENQSFSAVKVTGILLSFPGSSHAARQMKGVKTNGGLPIDAGKATYWVNGFVDLDPSDAENVVDNFVYLTGEAPAQLRLEVTCEGFSEPATVTLPLAAHQSPVTGGAYRFPYAAGELREDEYYTTSAGHWAMGSYGSQLYAHDIGVVGWDSEAERWSELVPGGDRLTKEDYRIWNKPLLAMADGTVEAWFDGMDDTTLTVDAQGHLQLPVPTPNPVGGNSITLKHGTELVQYCHLIKDSMPAGLRKKGTPVSEGEFLGRVGNSGNTSNPHTHIASVNASDPAVPKLRPLPFRDASVLERGKLSPPGAEGPWFQLKGHGISKDEVCIWPASTSPGFPVPTVGIATQGDWTSSYFIRPGFLALHKTAKDVHHKKGQRLIRATTFLDNGMRRWVGIARAGDWDTEWWLSGDLTSFRKTAQDLFDKQGLRLSHVHSFVEGDQRFWFGISRGGDWTSHLIIKDDLTSFSKEVQTLFDDQGLRLTQVLTWTEGARRRWFGIARSGTWAHAWWISPDIGNFFNTARKLFKEQGKGLVHVTTYREGTQRKWVGISRSGTGGDQGLFRSDLDSFGFEVRRLEALHRRLVHVEMLE